MTLEDRLKAARWRGRIEDICEIASDAIAEVRRLRAEVDGVMAEAADLSGKLVGRSLRYEAEVARLTKHIKEWSCTHQCTRCGARETVVIPEPEADGDAR